VIEDFRLHLHQRTKRDGTPLGWGSKIQMLLAVKGFFRWLTLTRRIPSNPAADVELPRRRHRLPREIMSAAEVETVLRQPDITTTQGLRNRAVLEVLYSTGIRRAECAGLTMQDLDFGRMVVLVRDGKGARDRYVPIGRRAVTWVDRYMRVARPLLARAPDCGHLFLSRSRTPLSAKRVGDIVHRCVASADVGKTGACHLLRHTTATLMLEGGADIRHIQELLGHTQLSTTALYARVSIRLLQEVHRRTHPSW
jgi:integrase/recombinase XerD